jgi:heat shock protein HtpX
MLPQGTLPQSAHCIALALVPTCGAETAPHVLHCGDTIVIEVLLPSRRPGLAIACRIRADARRAGNLHRCLNRVLNRRRSDGMITGMILLLAICGWIIGGDDGAERAVSVGAPLPQDSPILPEVILQRFGARLLHAFEMPLLFGILRDICHRACLPRLPDLYYLPTSTMNAYALGGPHRSAITLTGGLLQGMTLNEIAAILAHEVAHIRNSDTCAMTWASMLHHAIALTSLASLAALRERESLSSAPLAALLRCASAIGQLLYLALSRIRELDADATALELIDNPQALVSALYKLERHHSAACDPKEIRMQNGLSELMRSHPATWERVGMLRWLAPSI